MKFSAGDVLSRSFGVLLKNLVPFIVMGLVVYVPVFIVTVILYSQAATEQSFKTAQGVQFALRLLADYVVTGALVYGVFQDLRGERAGIGECLSVGFGRVFPVLGVAILTYLAVFVGSLLLVVPGIIFGCMLYVAVPVAVVERTGVMASLSRSAELTKGSRWAIFAIFLVIVALSFVLVMLVGGALATTSLVLVGVVALVVGLLFGLWQAVAQAVAYHDLRKEKEGVGIEELVKVFE